MSVTIDLPEPLIARLVAEALEEHLGRRRKLSFAEAGSCSGTAAAAEAESLLADGEFGIDGADL
jgi:hypothetical protein